jgi:hypothetical protein
MLARSVRGPRHLRLCLGALVYRRRLLPRESATVGLVMPLFAGPTLPTDNALVLAAGLPLQWLEGEGVAVENLRTPYGRLSYTLHSHSHRLVLKVAADLQPPPGGLVFVWPGALPASSALLNGTPVSWQGAELRIDQLRAEVSVGA